MSRAMWSVVVIMALVLITIVGVTRSVRAQDVTPSKMSAEDAARLDAALAHAQPYLNTVATICAEYKIAPLALMTGRVSVNFVTGDIARLDQSAASAAGK